MAKEKKMEKAPALLGEDLTKVVATQRFVIFTPSRAEMIQFDSYFSDGLKPPTSERPVRRPKNLSYVKSPASW